MNLLNTIFDCSKYGGAKSDGMYVKYFIAFDVLSVHILRIQENMNEDYEEEDGSVLLEHEMIDYFPEIIDYFEQRYKLPEYNGDSRVFINQMITKLGTAEVLKAITDFDAEEKGYENWECDSYHMTVDEVVQQFVLRDGFDNLSSTTI